MSRGLEKALDALDDLLRGKKPNTQSIPDNAGSIITIEPDPDIGMVRVVCHFGLLRHSCIFSPEGATDFSKKLREVAQEAQGLEPFLSEEELSDKLRARDEAFRKQLEGRLDEVERVLKQLKEEIGK